MLCTGTLSIDPGLAFVVRRLTRIAQAKTLRCGPDGWLYRTEERERDDIGSSPWQLLQNLDGLRRLGPVPIVHVDIGALNDAVLIDDKGRGQWEGPGVVLMDSPSPASRDVPHSPLPIHHLVPIRVQDLPVFCRKAAFSRVMAFVSH
jgi:hypothetical protein